MDLSPYHFGARRDDEVVALVTRLRYLTADQVARCLFQARRRVAARRLLRLVGQGRLQTRRLAATYGPAVYFASSRSFSRAVREALAVTELYCRLIETKPASATLDRFDVELPSGSIRPDALLVARVAGRDKAVLLEWDTGSTALERVARKVPAYEAFAAGGGHRRSSWWRTGMEVSVVVAVPEFRTDPLLRLIPRLATSLRPQIVPHERLLQNPWKTCVALREG